MNIFARKNCLITGAASGIGRSTAIAVGKLGAHLFLTDINQALLDETVDKITADGGIVDLHQALDIADYESVRQFADIIHSRFGPMDMVMNIAGISTWGEIDRLTYEHWEKCINVDLWGPIHGIICFLPEMIRNGRGGRLVNVASAAGLVAFPWHVVYSAAKFGLVGVSEVLRYDLMKHNIGVTLVCPGAVETPLKHSVEIVGVDRNHPRIKKFEAKFSKRAVSPDKVAQQIISGVQKNKFLVFTSMDIRLLYWLKRKHHWVYNIIMKKANRIASRVIGQAQKK